VRVHLGPVWQAASPPRRPLQRRGFDFLDERIAGAGKNDNLVVGILADVEKGRRQLFVGLGSEYQRAAVGMQSDFENLIIAPIRMREYLSA
jgi:hypothetical protein